MSRKELMRLHVMHRVESKVITLRAACEEMGVSERQGKRIWRRYRREGEEGLVHAGRGRPSNRQTPPELRKLILALYKAHYEDYGPTLASEMLEEEHGIVVHPETLRRFLHQEHLLVPRCGPKVHRKYRQRRAHFGAMLQIDGSFHEWHEGRGPRTCLMVAVDDATGKSLMWMGEEETTLNAFIILKKWIERYGIPEALYVDRRSVYVANREATPEEKKQGSGALTDFGRACWKLGIRIIAAHSPQAKGRVERRNGLLQDRLVKFLRRRAISTIEGTNAVLEEFAQDLDRRFALAPQSPIDSHRRKPLARVLHETLCWEQTRTVTRDWTLSCDGATYQILRQENAPQPGKKVTVRRLMDGTIRILYEERKLRYSEIGMGRKNQTVIRSPMGDRPDSPSEEGPH